MNQNNVSDEVKLDITKNEILNFPEIDDEMIDKISDIIEAHSKKVIKKFIRLVIDPEILQQLKNKGIKKCDECENLYDLAEKYFHELYYFRAFGTNDTNMKLRATEALELVRREGRMFRKSLADYSKKSNGCMFNTADEV
jgi:hypothetical protein